MRKGFRFLDLSEYMYHLRFNFRSIGVESQYTPDESQYTPDESQWTPGKVPKNTNEWMKKL